MISWGIHFICFLLILPKTFGIFVPEYFIFYLILTVFDNSRHFAILVFFFFVFTVLCVSFSKLQLMNIPRDCNVLYFCVNIIYYYEF